jgi:hypothetical protein
MAFQRGETPAKSLISARLTNTTFLLGDRRRKTAMDLLQSRLTDISRAADWDSDEDESFFNELDRICEDAVSEFTFERLRSFYISEPHIYLPVRRRITEANELCGTNVNASLVFSLSAAELCLKTLILRPMVHGFVHQSYVAHVIADLAVSHTGWNRFSELLSNILRDKLRIDLDVIKISNTNKLLWNEFHRLSTIRNRILHRGEVTDLGTARNAIAVANEFSENIFRNLLSNFSLSLDTGGNIVDIRDH